MSTHRSSSSTEVTTIIRRVHSAGFNLDEEPRSAPEAVYQTYFKELARLGALEAQPLDTGQVA